MTKVRILHISDIHFRWAAKPGDRADLIRRETPRRTRVIGGPKWRRNLDDLLGEGPIDLVCLTGDVADYGKAEEFELATSFVKALMGDLKLPMTRLFVVPGNHDIDRSVHKGAWEGIRKQPWTLHAEVSDWLAGGKPPPGADGQWREQIRERQSAFWAWVEQGLGRPALLPANSPHQRLGYRVDASPELGLPSPFWILGLDTAWLAGNDAEAGKLLLTKDQLLQLCSDATGHPLPGFRLALGHHPLAELADEVQSRRLLAEHADLYLRGHQHQALSTLTIDPDHSSYELAAGCLFEGTRKDDHKNGFQVITLELDADNRPRSAELRFRSWSPSGDFWHDDSSIYERAKQGRLTLTWGGGVALASSSVQPSPTRLRHSAVQLFGRKKDLAWLDRAWEGGIANVVTIVAWGGVGKTSLVGEWRNLLLEAGGVAEGMFEWSFYSQGVRDQGAASADSFLREALRYFGDPALAESAASPWDKGRRLAQLVGARRALLILDGLEPLQYPENFAGSPGALKEGAIEALLKGLAVSNRGLCVVTTRVAVPELVQFGLKLAPRLDLDKLSEQAGSEFLRSLLEPEHGKPVTSTADERKEISRAVEGHALTLQLLGVYIQKALGNVRKWREIDFARANEVQGGHAFRVIEAYVTWLAGAGIQGQQQLAVLRLLGLFDRPADPGCIAALRKAPVIAGVTEALAGLDAQAWRLLTTSLEQLRLVTRSDYAVPRVLGYDEAAAQRAGERGPPSGPPEEWRPRDVGDDTEVLDAHPLVREFFARELRRGNEAGWREGHQRVCEHLCDSVPYWPEGVEGLQPLYQAVVHGCAAGRIESAYKGIYQNRILRRERAYSTNQLGAIGANLAALGCFFEQVWDQPSLELSEADRSWVLNEAALQLQALGRLSEALGPMCTSLKMAIEHGEWGCAAVAAHNLSLLRLTYSGPIPAIEDAVHSVEYADHRNDVFWRVASRAALAYVRHHAGDHEVALELFERAEAMQVQAKPEFPCLFSAYGYQYCDLMLSPAECSAWRGALGKTTCERRIVRLCCKVFIRMTQALTFARNEGLLHDIALHYHTLGRAALYCAVLRPHANVRHAAILRRHRGGTHALEKDLTFATARKHIEAAVDVLRKAGQVDYLTRGLITRAWLRHHEKSPDLVRADLDDAWALAERGPMPLHQADIQLTRARLFHDRTALADARRLIIRYSYNRRLEELADAERALLP